MVLMLPTATDNGARLAAILPTGLASLTLGHGESPGAMLSEAVERGVGSADPASTQTSAVPASLDLLTPIRGFVMVVVDGLGSANLQATRAHAPTLARLGGKRIETVLPSTTGAALTTLATGQLPGQHGLIGYKIRHPKLGLRTTLKEWEGIDEVREWQRAQPLWALAGQLSARSVAIGRPSHASGGLTSAILTGAEYHGARTIADRFATASDLFRGGDSLLAYLYIDELDKAAHSDGWQSALWLKRLEALDTALGDFLRALPGDVGVIVTADHGVLDIPRHRRMNLDVLAADSFDRVEEVGGEPRMRSLYLEEGADPESIAVDLSATLGKLAWVGTREEAIDAGWFGPVDPQVAPRLGEVIVAARAQVAFTLSHDSAEAVDMVGQHGGLSAEERGVPLLLAGALAGTGFGAAVASLARERSQP